jgi:hypothetical protein
MLARMIKKTINREIYLISRTFLIFNRHQITRGMNIKISPREETVHDVNLIASGETEKMNAAVN